MKSVLFFIESLDGGGAEAILKNIVTAIDKSKFDVTVVTETDNECHTEEVKSVVKHRSFTAKDNLTPLKMLYNKALIKLSLFASESFTRKFLIKGKYDVEIAFCEGYATKVIGNSKSKAKKIAWIHTDVINHPWSESIFGSAEKERECYEKFDAIVCVSETMRDSFIKKYGMAYKIHVIYNVIDNEAVIKNSREKAELHFSEKPVFSLAGRLTKVKGYDRLVNVCARLKSENYKLSVVIMGKGSESENIKEMIADNSLESSISLLGFQKNPQKYVAASDAFVCSSYAEGYSTAVIEAVMLNIPVITTECSGMREIFGDRECGIICENSEEGLYNAIKKVLDNPLLLDHFRKEEKIRSGDFSMAERIRKVENFLDKI